jgi:hypothetical protein
MGGLKVNEIFLVQAGGALELVAGKHYPCDTANAEIRKDGSLAYKITRICLVTALEQPELFVDDLRAALRPFH